MWTLPTVRSMQQSLLWILASAPRKSLGQLCNLAVGLILATILLTAALGQNFYNQPRLKADRYAPKTLIATATATVVNPQATELARARARNLPPVLRLDLNPAATAHQQLARRFGVGDQIRRTMGMLPYLDEPILSVDLQRTLRQSSDAEWAALKAALAAKRPATDLSPWQQQVLSHLQNRPQKPLSFWLKKIQESRQLYRTALTALSDPALSEQNHRFNHQLLQLPQAQWQQLQKKLPPILDRMYAQGIAPGLAPGLLDRALDLQLTDLPPALRPIAKPLLISYLTPNLVPDDVMTAAQADRAALSIPEQTLAVKQGEAIVTAGQIITPEQFLLLEHFNLSHRGVDWPGLTQFGAITGGIIWGFWRLVEGLQPSRSLENLRCYGLRRRDYALMGLLALTTPLMLVLRVPATNLPMVAMLLAPFYGGPVALLAVAGLGFLLPLGMPIQRSQWLPSLAVGLIVAALSGKRRSREDLAFLGGACGLTQGLLYFALQMVLSAPLSRNLLETTLVQGLMGVAWCIVAIGVSPYLERVFDLVPTLRLVELANLNQPLLKRLARETPGTFQHTLSVANFAETAAQHLGCNVELVRAGTLYHDIGKLHDPLGFIENQMGGPNKHDQLDDPWQSAQIIRKHVTEGLAMARRAGLPRAVQAFIPEHQGTMTIAYFYHQARARDDQTEETPFRYAGPNPQSRETGIVMLADSSEAALRSLDSGSVEQAQNMLQKIFRARWSEGYLSESGLAREDLDRIAEVFITVWQQSNHQRIKYPS
jgi:cyclic-di-AMP phosphodiesterase PgpH